MKRRSNTTVHLAVHKCNNFQDKWTGNFSHMDNIRAKMAKFGLACVWLKMFIICKETQRCMLFLTPPMTYASLHPLSYQG